MAEIDRGSTLEEERAGASPVEQPGHLIGGPKPSIGTRLWFAWFAVVALLVTIPFSLVQFATHAATPTARNFKRNAGGWGRTILWLIGVRVRVEHRAPLDPERPYVYVSNHQNLLDILALAGYLPHPFGFLAKAELGKVPFLGFALRHSASIFIDRTDPRRSIESLQEAGAQIRSGASVLVFPEGSRSYAAALGPLKKGAFAVATEAQVPVVPVTLVDAHRLMNESRYTARPGVIHLVVGEPIPMDGKRRKDIPDIMAAVQAQYEEALAG